jgi:hypothetical protein
MTTQSEWLQRLRAEKEQWEALLSRLSEAQIIAANQPDGWSIKDVLAHLMAWQQRTNARLAAARHGGQPNYPAWPADLNPETEDVDALNAWLYATYRDQPWATISAAWRAGFQNVIDQSAALPEPDLIQPGHFAWLGDTPLAAYLEGTLEHHREHRAWLKQPG